MSLKDAINNTNTQKENVKQVATQIDNKLVELGGEQAVNLVDVPNKIEKMIGQYKKIARGSSKKVGADATRNGYAIISIPLNLESEPKLLIISIESKLEYKSSAPYQYDFTITNEDADEYSAYEPELRHRILKVYIRSLDRNKLELRIGFETEEEYLVNIDWISIL